MKTSKRLLPAVAAVASLLFGIAASASAAGLTYSADTTVSLTGANELIKATSTAETTVYNANSIVATFSGVETFTVTSATKDILVTQNSASGTITASVICIAGSLSQLTITSSGGATGSFTISPSTLFSCAAGGSGGGGGGGGGGGSGYVAPTPTPTTTLAGIPVISSFVANPAVLSSGQTSTLSWNVSGATNLSISPTVGSEPAAQSGSNGSVQVTPAATTTYTLTASTVSGQATAQATVTVSGTAPVNSPAPTPTPVQVPMPVSGAHPDGTLVNHAGTVYLIRNGELYGFRLAGEYKTYGFTFSQVVPANSVDMTLPSGGILKAADGSLVLDSSDNRTVYLVDGGQRRGFTSYGAFTGLGYAKSAMAKLNLSDYPAGAPVSSASAVHPAGALVKSGGTVYVVTAGGQLAPFTSLAVFNSYGYSFAQVVPANAADVALPRTSPVLLRDGTLVSSNGSYYIISDGQARAFSSLANMVAAGYSVKNVVTVNLSSYPLGAPTF